MKTCLDWYGSQHTPKLELKVPFVPAKHNTKVILEKQKETKKKKTNNNKKWKNKRKHKG
jgi:hypothetical protein